MEFPLWQIEDFTIKDLLAEVGAELNIPSFMEGRQQLPPYLPLDYHL